VLGDQPGLSVPVIEQVVDAFRQAQGSVIIPSYQMRRGHPILIGRNQWDAVLGLKEGQTLRDFIRRVSAEIYHVAVDAPSILRDMDTPDDYRRELAAYLDILAVHRD
jgi:molybdenum cofactor cytidylyltransferase